MKNLLNKIIRYRIPDPEYRIKRQNRVSSIWNPTSGILYLATAVLLSLTFLSCEEMLLGPEQENTPKSNFEIMWENFDKNYALFPVKNVNWDSLHEVYGSKITSSTTQTELWNIMGDMIAKLNDGHVTVFNKDITEWYGSSEINRRKIEDFSFELIKNKYLVDIKTAGGGYFAYGIVKSSLSSKKLVYIYIPTFAGSNTDDESKWAYDIDIIVQKLYDCDAIIIDLRNNGGGLKVTGWTIASVFIDREITFFYQWEKTGPGHNDFGEAMPLTISPRNGVLHYNKKIALLTNRLSASGSEHFAQIFKNLSYATQIGDTTFGAFGDKLGAGLLPNGWTFQYPCRLTKTPEGYCPEGIGIIPDILVENTKAGIDAGRDNVIQRAIDYLSQ